MTNADIDYRLIADAIDKYKHRGYTYIEAPWIVGPIATYMTHPDDRNPYEFTQKLIYPVGSAEQAFIEMMMSGALKPGSYVAAGPCFRNEPKCDELHQKTFFKVELIHVMNTRETNFYSRSVDKQWYYDKIVSDSEDVHSELFPDSYVKCRRFPNGFIDIEINGIEVGSCGTREHGKHSWHFATGLALPRATIAVSKL